MRACDVFKSDKTETSPGRLTLSGFEGYREPSPGLACVTCPGGGGGGMVCNLCSGLYAGELAIHADFAREFCRSVEGYWCLVLLVLLLLFLRREEHVGGGMRGGKGYYDEGMREKRRGNK